MKRVIVERNRYFDSVFLMRISSELERMADIVQAVVAMATPLNLENLANTGFDVQAEGGPLRTADLLIAIEASSEGAIKDAREHLNALLAGSAESPSGQASDARPHSLASALKASPEANLALISVPGIHAAREARLALQRGLHVMLFSDNVSVEDEIALKDEAIEQGLLMMGPDCGTAILNGAALGFANVCRRGQIGIVGASGTGIQEISSLIHRLGGGISQAIGTGGRDLSARVAGRMTRFGISALGRDPETDVVVIVSKTPSPAVADSILATLADTGMPSVVHFIGADAEVLSDQVEMTSTLADAAQAAVIKAGIDAPITGPITEPVSSNPGATGRVVGLYCGGTLCQETWSLLHKAGFEVRSNVAGEDALKVSAETPVEGHVVWDLGDDVFTRGRPHPMIEPSLRDDRVAAAGDDPSVGWVLVDCVIGYGAHDNPAESLAAASALALDTARQAGRSLQIIASVTGTELDPQNLNAQRHVLEAAGVHVAPSNAAAARWAMSQMGEVTP